MSREAIERARAYEAMAEAERDGRQEDPPARYDEPDPDIARRRAYEASEAGTVR